jgi:hypothetical protein
MHEKPNLDSRWERKAGSGKCSKDFWPTYRVRTGLQNQSCGVRVSSGLPVSRMSHNGSAERCQRSVRGSDSHRPLQFRPLSIVWLNAPRCLRGYHEFKSRSGRQNAQGIESPCNSDAMRRRNISIFLHPGVQVSQLTQDAFVVQAEVVQAAACEAADTECESPGSPQFVAVV